MTTQFSPSELFEQLTQSSEQLLDTLKAEYQALKADNIEVIQSLALQKEQLVSQLNHLEAQRQHWQNTESNAQEFSHFLATLNPSFSDSWEHIRYTTRLSQQMNQTNGMLLNRKHHLAQELLGILTGNDNTSGESYTAQGNNQYNLTSYRETQA